MKQNERSYAKKKLREQFDRVPLDDELKMIINESIVLMSDRKALKIAEDLEKGLDNLPKALELLKKSGHKLGS